MMLESLLLLAASLSAGEEATPAPPTPLDALAGTGADAGRPHPLQSSGRRPRRERGGLVTPFQPTWFVSTGVRWYDGGYRTPTGADPSEDVGYAVDAGYFSWSGDLGAALEIGLSQATYDVDTGSGGREEVDVMRILGGIRFVDRLEESPFETFLRAGAVYREDDGATVNDDGTGWYAGGGLDWILGSGEFLLGLDLMWMETSSVSSEDWVLGVHMTFRM